MNEPKRLQYLLDNPQEAKPEGEARSRSMPNSWIERIFEVMAGKYGARFADAWLGVDPETVKREWARDLGKLNPEQILRGVELLEECKFPPTLPEFIALCKRAQPMAHRLALPKPRPSEEERARGRDVLAKCKKMLSQAAA